MKRRKNNRGAALGAAILLAAALIFTGASFLAFVEINLEDTGHQWDEAQALYLAESGAADAIWYLENVDSTWVGDGAAETILATGTYIVTVDHVTEAPTSVITVTGYVPDQANVRAQKVVEVRGTLN